MMGGMAYTSHVTCVRKEGSNERFEANFAQDSCNTLQHTATHCSILQHTVAYCNTLQHTATHCSILQHTAAQTQITNRRPRLDYSHTAIQ